MQETNQIVYGQIITLDNKYYSYSEEVGDREWNSDPIKAIFWNNKLTDLTKIYVPDEFKEDMKKAKLIPIKKTITIEFI